ncbi:MAG: hypothetical protein ACYCUI_16185 [Vulcanimicrobiaceae bacterium]
MSSCEEGSSSEEIDSVVKRVTKIKGSSHNKDEPEIFLLTGKEKRFIRVALKERLDKLCYLRLLYRRKQEEKGCPVKGKDPAEAVEKKYKRIIELFDV